MKGEAARSRQAYLRTTFRGVQKQGKRARARVVTPGDARNGGKARNRGTDITRVRRIRE